LVGHSEYEWVVSFADDKGLIHDYDQRKTVAYEKEGMLAASLHSI